MSDMITAEEAGKLLEEVARNQPRVCVAWCGKAKDDCACYKSGVAVGALNEAAPDKCNRADECIATRTKD